MATAEQWIDSIRALGPARWAESQHGWIGPDGAPIVLAPWQAAVLETWWSHRHDVTTLAISNIKKTGKTWTNAVLTAWRWLAMPGVHFCVGNDLDQSAGRQFSEIAEMCKRHPYLSRHVKDGKKELMFTPTGSTLTALACDAAGNAGANHLTASHTECWAILYEQGIRAFEELTPPPGIFYELPCLRICDSYAGFLGESETWHNLVDRALAGLSVSADWPIFKAGRTLLFHIEGQQAQKRCYRHGDAPEYYTEQRAALRPVVFSRMHENKRQQGEGDFIPLESWLALEDANIGPLWPGAPFPLYLGVDLAVSPTGDNAALTAIYEWKGKMAVGLHKIWRASDHPGEYLNLYEIVGPYILEIAKNHPIGCIAFDPWQGVATAQRLAALGLPVVLCPQTGAGRGASDTGLYNLIAHGQLAYYPDDDLRDATQHARAKELPDGKVFITKKRGKIDLLISMSIALWGMMNAPPQCIERVVYRPVRIE